MSTAAQNDAANDAPAEYRGMPALRRTAAAIVDTVLPPRCLSCGQVVQGSVGFCPECWSGLTFLDGPACARCDRPLPYVVIAGTLCGACCKDPPPYKRVLAPLAYGPAARDVVMRLKYGRRVATATIMARLMEPSLRRLLAEAQGPPLLVPVPLYRWRLWWRGFNQAAVMAGQLARLTGTPVLVDALVRTRSTGSLRGRGRAERARQVKGAFAASAGRRDAIARHHIILVDDVFTTGATADACARVLAGAGAAQVSVLAFARTLDDAIGHAPAAGLTAPGEHPIS